MPSTPLRQWSTFNMMPGLVVHTIGPQNCDMSALSRTGAGHRQLRLGWAAKAREARKDERQNSAELRVRFRQAEFYALPGPIGRRLDVVETVALGLSLSHAHQFAKLTLLVTGGSTCVDAVAKATGDPDEDQKPGDGVADADADADADVDASSSDESASESGESESGSEDEQDLEAEEKSRQPEVGRSPSTKSRPVSVAMAAAAAVVAARKKRNKKKHPRTDTSTLLKVAMAHLNESSRLCPMTVELAALLTGTGGAGRGDSLIMPRDSKPIAPREADVATDKLSLTQTNPMPNVFLTIENGCWVDSRRDGAIRMLSLDLEATLAIVRLVEIRWRHVCSLSPQDHADVIQTACFWVILSWLYNSRVMIPLLGRTPKVQEVRENVIKRIKAGVAEASEKLGPDPLNAQWVAYRDRTMLQAKQQNWCPTVHDLEENVKDGELSKVMSNLLLLVTKAYQMRANLSGDLLQIVNMVQPALLADVQSSLSPDVLAGEHGRASDSSLEPAYMYSYSLFQEHEPVLKDVQAWVAWVAMLAAALRLLKISSDKFNLAFRLALQKYFVLSTNRTETKKDIQVVAAAAAVAADSSVSMSVRDTVAILSATSKAVVKTQDKAQKPRTALKKANSLADTINEIRIRKRMTDISAMVGSRLGLKVFVGDGVSFLPLLVSPLTRTRSRLTQDETEKMVQLIGIQLDVLSEAQRMAMMSFPMGAHAVTTLQYLCERIAQLYYNKVVRDTQDNAAAAAAAAAGVGDRPLSQSTVPRQNKTVKKPRAVRNNQSHKKRKPSAK
jgi:hypothetical protein